MKVSTKLSGAFAVYVVLLIGLLVYHVRTTRDVVATSYDLSEISSRLYISSTEQLGRIGEMEENAAKYRVTRDRGYLDRFRELFDAFDAALDRLRSLELSERERAEVSGLAESWDAFRSTTARLRLTSQETPPSGVVRDSLGVLQTHFDELRRRARRVAEASRLVMVARLERSANAARHAERLSWVAVAGALVLSVLVSSLIVRFISDSLNRLTEGTREVAEGNFAHRLDADGSDEFADVARDFNTMTRRLGQLDRMKHSFISKVSHDLKTPLASMRETVDILLEEVPGGLTERQRRLLRLNARTGERLSSMIAKLLDLSRLEAGALEPDLRTHAVGPLVRRVVDQTEATATERGLRIRVDVPERALLLECDGERILRVLDNLLENALKFSPDDGAVRVAVRFCRERPDDIPDDRWRDADRPESASGTVLFTVSDEGPGIPDEDKEHVFDQFFQAEAGRRVRGRGVGLGLTICREVVAAHGGAIWVDDRPGGGSIFHVLVPGALLVPDEATFAALAATPEEPNAL